jgi:sec-independent protein translocase protein TatA
MFGSIGFPELLVIMSIALLVFGPKKLPEVGRSIGKALREFRRTSDEIKEKIEEEIQASEFKDIKKDIDAVTNFKFDASSEPDNPYEHVESTPTKTPDKTEDVTSPVETPEESTKKADQDESGTKVT